MNLPTTCPDCGLEYDDMRTGLTFADVRQMMFVANPDPSTWRFKRRHGVLGAWHQAKLSMWADHLAVCRHYTDAPAVTDPLPAVSDY